MARRHATASRRRRLARALGWLGAIALALGVAVSVTVQTPGFRRYVVTLVNGRLEGSVRGRITLEGLTRLGWSGAELERLRVDDEAGQTLLLLEGVRVRFDPIDLLGPWLPSPRRGLSLAHVRVDRSRVRLATDPESGGLTLARVFGLDTARPPGAPKPAPLTFTFDSIELGEVEVALDLPGVGQHRARLHRVRGDAIVDGEDTEVNVERFGVLVLEDGVRWLDGTGTFRLQRKGVLGGNFHGFVRGTEFDLVAQLDQGEIALRLDVPNAMPERLRELWPGWPLLTPVAARVAARGPRGALVIEGGATSEGSRADVTGNADLEHAVRLHLDVAAQALDLRSVSADGPATALDARARIDLSRGSDGWLAVASAKTEPVQIGALQLPAVELSLRSAGGVSTGHYALADARGSLEGDIELTAQGGADLTARFARVSLRAWPELAGRADGQLSGQARAHVGEGRFRGDVEAQVDDFRLGQIGLASSRLTGSFRGELAAPAEAELDLSLAADDVRLGPVRLAQLRVSGRGPWHTSRLEAELKSAHGASGSARARLDLRDEARLETLSARWTDRDVVLEAEVERWLLGSGAISIQRVALSGSAGTLEASAQVTPGRLELSATAEQLDTDAAGRVLGLSQLPLRGLFSGTLSVSSTPRGESGQLAVRGEKVRALNVSLGAVDARATLAERHLELDVTARDASLGRLELRGAGDLGGRALELDAWRRATGSGSLALSELPLWPLGLLLGEQSRLKDFDGRLDVALKIERSDAGVMPDAFLQASSAELGFALASEVAGGADRRFDGFAVHGSASIAGKSGRGAASVRVTDEHGALVTTSGTLQLDLAALLRQPETIPERLFRAPLDALLRLHPRPVSQLPYPLELRDLSGSVEASLQLRGSLAEPTLELAARGHQLQGGVTAGARAVDVTSLLEYVPQTGRLRGSAEVAQQGNSLVAARLEGRLPNPLDPAAQRDPVELRAAAMLNGVPLDLVPFAARERVQARLYGSVDVEKEPGEPLRQRAHLEIADLVAQGHPLGNGRLTLEDRGDGLRAELRVGSRDHNLRASVRGAPPEASGDASIEGELTARAFHAASLSPLTSGLLSRLSGSMDADLRFRLRPGAGDNLYLGIDGDATLESGSAHVEELGLEVREIAANVRARSTPEYTVIQIDPLAAKARSRSQNLKGNAELWLRGRRVVNGEADLALDDVPLSLKGVSRGIARGRVRARLERQPDHLRLEVKLPELRVRLPPSSTRSLIELDPNPDWHVLQSTTEDEIRSPDALLWRVQFDLGKNVRIQRGDLDIPLTGQPVLEYQHEVRPSGTIEALPGGRITLFGQIFNVDRGLVQLVPDEPDNPRVDFTASWRAPDGTTVYVDITGRAKDASVLTRDDRGLQEVERFFLITGGSMPEGSAVADGGRADSGAIGQTFSLGINELLRNSLGNVAVSVGTTAENRASYSASVRLSDKLTFQGSFQPASESSLEESTNDLTGTLDYRFSRRWSLRTELGTSGGAFDLLWSHRY
jgi:hypothetical protein